MAKKKIKPLTGNDGDFSGIVLKAAARGDLTAVKHYLKMNPAWLNRECPHGRTLLWEATYKGRYEMVAELIAMGANVNPMGSYYTPMLVTQGVSNSYCPILTKQEAELVRALSVASCTSLSVKRKDCNHGTVATIYGNGCILMEKIVVGLGIAFPVNRIVV